MPASSESRWVTTYVLSVVFGRQAACAIALTALMGCAASEQHETEATFGQSRQALTNEQTRILGFEAPTTDWTASAGTLGASTDANEGATSLSVVPDGWIEISSTPLSTLSGVRDTLSYDLYLPEVPTWGETRAILVAPSLNLSAELGSWSLSSLPAGQWSTVTFPLTSGQVEALSDIYADLTIKLVIDAPALPQPYLIDNLIMTDESQPDPQPPGPGSEVTVCAQIPAGTPVEDTVLSATHHLSVFSQAHVAIPNDEKPLVANFGEQPTHLQSLFARAR